MKRKSKSQMIHAIPLPEFRTAQPVVKCFVCKCDYPKARMNKAIKLMPTYICDGCKGEYSGKLEFKKCLDKAE